MRIVVLMLVVLPISACVTSSVRTPLQVRAASEDGSCQATIDGAQLPGIRQLKALARAHHQAASLNLISNVQYKCVGGTIIQLQHAGFKYISILQDGAALRTD